MNSGMGGSGFCENTGELTVLHVLDNQVKGVLEYFLERLKELRTSGTVDHAVVAGHRHAHHLPHHDLVLAHDRLRRHCAHGQDRTFRWIDHSGELVDSEHAKVTDRETCPRVLLGFQLSLAGSLCQARTS